jgi:hypothetical protein
MTIIILMLSFSFNKVWFSNRRARLRKQISSTTHASNNIMPPSYGNPLGGGGSGLSVGNGGGANLPIYPTPVPYHPHSHHSSMLLSSHSHSSHYSSLSSNQQHVLPDVHFPSASQGL